MCTLDKIYVKIYERAEGTETKKKKTELDK